MPVYIRVLDVNDNPPAFAANYETFVCENAKANQVGVARKDQQDPPRPRRRRFGRTRSACCSSKPVSPPQRIQIISATDPDEPLAGHRFFFSLAQEAAGKANFSVRDNKGNAGLVVHTCRSAAVLSR